MAGKTRQEKRKGRREGMREKEEKKQRKENLFPLFHHFLGQQS